MKKKNVIAVCGKGGVGKTVTSGALVRTLAEMGQRVLAIDADPAMELSFILGLPTDIKTICEENNRHGRAFNGMDRVAQENPMPPGG